MELVFVCPETNAVFNSADYAIMDNNGIRTDPQGRKYMDAAVLLTTPCPSCGRIHRYDVGELSCPFGS
ncbi:hypothetical protein [Desulfatitalea alkaliphila]|uniref:Uncharacterized protein n=1 Tax=Desulfatitalea alkaliphila TaxID=2929485 RepID=A0AA41R0B2_9BACT|nr:hypothetical protein [Desulfatitalea alkaliphila]MCJ8499653.1 hypothetical protein [Desulfatitalea alkaliphila]